MVLRRSRSRRAVATVLFTDIVSSTERAEALGDRAWKELLARHHRLVRRHLKRHRGREVDTAGDGFFAIFEQPGDAIACALDVAGTVGELGIQIRAGVHTGEVEPTGRKFAGIAVHVGARILASAEPGQVVVSSTVRELATGSGHKFVELGPRRLKGVEGEWRLFAVAVPAPTEQPAGAAGPVQTSRRLLRPALIGAGVLLIGGVSAAVAILLTGGNGVETPTGGNTVLAVATADGELGAGFAGGRGPSAILVTGERLWVANTEDGTVSRIDASDGDADVIGAGVPTALASASDRIWVLDPFASTVSIVLPDDPRIVDTIEVHGRAIAAAGDAVWVADDIHDAVHRLDARTGAISATIDLPAGSGPSAIAADPANVWVVNALSGSLAHIDAATNEVVVNAIALSGRPTAVAVSEGRVWVTSGEQDLLIEVDASTNRAIRPIEVCDIPAAVAASEGAVWVACQGDRTLRRVDPAGGDPQVTPLDGVPAGIALDGNRVWVTVRDS